MITITIEDETTTSNHPAKAIVKENGIVVATILAIIKYEEGADGGIYPVVKMVGESIHSGLGEKIISGGAVYD
jgi:orotate phosphoribosyltransferase